MTLPMDEIDRSARDLRHFQGYTALPILTRTEVEEVGNKKDLI